MGLKGNLLTMLSKTYTEEFKRDVVAVYENSSGASLTTIAADLGINRATLHNWVKKYSAAARTTVKTRILPRRPRSPTPIGSDS